MTQPATTLTGQIDIVDHLCLDIVSLLRDEILRLYQTNAKSAPSLNRRGWKSQGDFFRDRRASQAVRTLRDEVTPRILQRAGVMWQGRAISGWAMVNHHGSRHPRHDHRTSIVSGVYYVDPGEAPLSATVFELADKREVCVDPVAGRLVLFPGSMYHQVRPYWGWRPRITIAFDLPRDL